MLIGMSGTPYTPPITRRMVRRTAIASAVVAVVALAVLIPIGYGGFAAFGVLGLVLGMGNNLLALISANRFAQYQPSKVRFAGSVLARLAVITVVAFACALLFRPAGFGVFAGLVVFQLLGVLSSMLPLIKEIRQK